MATPGLLINTFVKQNKKTVIDALSKIFIVTECVFGLNRCAILEVTRTLYTLLFLHAALVNTIVVWHYSQMSKTDYLAFLMIVKYTQYIGCIVLSFLTWRRIRDFFSGLEEFDYEIGFRPKMTWLSYRICGQVAVVTIITILIFMLHFDVVFILVNMPVLMINILENHFYAHMLRLLTSRLRMLNEGIQSSLKSACKHVEQRKVKIKMERLMDFYNIVVMAHTKLVNGIKWQLLLIITTSFVFVLGLCYRIAVDVIREHTAIPYTMIRAAVSLVEFIPVFAPCLCSDQLKAEVQRLKELLAAKIYEGNINKPSRSSARTLLALTETHDLSFPLLRMVDISISLPFKFIGLLVTYLIILLQFEKVFNSPKINNE